MVGKQERNNKQRKFMTNICSNCGAKNKPTNTRCKECGSSL